MAGRGQGSFVGGIGQEKVQKEKCRSSGKLSYRFFRGSVSLSCLAMPLSPLSRTRSDHHRCADWRECATRVARRRVFCWEKVSLSHFFAILLQLHHVVRSGIDGCARNCNESRLSLAFDPLLCSLMLATFPLLRGSFSLSRLLFCCCW